MKCIDCGNDDGNVPIWLYKPNLLDPPDCYCPRDEYSNEEICPCKKQFPYNNDTRFFGRLQSQNLQITILFCIHSYFNQVSIRKFEAMKKDFFSQTQFP